MNGTLLSAREVQSEYWKLKQFSLFMCIASFLQSDTWLDTEGALPEGAEVTVLPGGSSDVAPHKDAFIATIAVGHVDVGRNVLYRLRKDGVLLSEMIPRHRLRHRVWYSICFACVTNEKRHDAPSTQHFLNKVTRRRDVATHPGGGAQGGGEAGMYRGMGRQGGGQGGAHSRRGT